MIITQTHMRQPAFLGSVAGAFGIVLGVLVIFGWYVDAPALLQILPTFAPMQINTAFCFLASGVSLVMHSRKQAVASFWLGCFVLFPSPDPKYQPS